jgi:hypothetical protein
MVRLQAPSASGEVLAVPNFDEVPRLIRANQQALDRDDVQIDRLPLRSLRRLARREALRAASPSPDQSVDPESPLLLTGHQPELSHPGVWVKNFALNGLARQLRCHALYLIADTDTLKATSLQFPVWTNHVAQLRTLAYDTFAGAQPYEERPVLDAELFRTFVDRSASLWANWGYEPLLRHVWKLANTGLIGERFTGMRRAIEWQWGCRNPELTVSCLSKTEAFAHFARHILRDLPRFRTVYNAAIRAYRSVHQIRSRNHPAPELAEDEAPFWVHTGTGYRQKATAHSGLTHLRPRALTLTLFARVCLGDFFIHGIGGGKYDEVTDTIIREYFGISPPAYQVLSATLHLPLPGFATTLDDLRQTKRLVRDLYWNPQRHLPPGSALELVRLKAAVAAAEPPIHDHLARRVWFRQLKEITEQLRPFVADQLSLAEQKQKRQQTELAANQVLRRRDLAWVLYPEATLRPFLQRFLSLTSGSGWSAPL